jgi:hypothetical protein
MRKHVHHCQLTSEISGALARPLWIDESGFGEAEIIRDKPDPRQHLLR